MAISRRMEGPDHGWSWVVAGACFFASLVLAGIFRTSGVLFVAFIHSFGVSREEASWPMVLCISVLNLTGPFSGILGQKFGARPIIITGSLIATIGIASCFFAASLKVITFLFGCVFGLGWGFMNTLMPGVLNAYFLNLRATANGIANSGSCFGSLILPVLFEYFITAYGLAGCFLLTGGIVLNIAVAGALMKPPPWLQTKKGHLNETKYFANRCQIDLESPESNKHLPLQQIVKDKNKTSVVKGLSSKEEKLEKNKLLTDESSYVNEWKRQHEVQISSQAKSGFQPVSTDKNIINSAKTGRMSNEEIKSDSMRNILRSFVTVLLCPMFYVTAITNVSFYFLYHMYVVIIVDFALDRKVPAGHTKDMLFAFSIADMFGRLCFGWITDRKYVSRSKFVMICMIMIGIVFFLFPFSTDYWTLIAASCSYGLLLGCTMVIYPILLVDFLGIELHAVSYGCMCFMNGFASFGRPFLIGYFRDRVGSYSNMFYVLGGISTAASLLWLLEDIIGKRKRQRDM